MYVVTKKTKKTYQETSDKQRTMQTKRRKVGHGKSWKNGEKKNGGNCCKEEDVEKRRHGPSETEKKTQCCHLKRGAMIRKSKKERKHFPAKEQSRRII